MSIAPPEEGQPVDVGNRRRVVTEVCRATPRAFRSLLPVERFFGVADERTAESPLAQSATDGQEVTDQLGSQARKAIEVLVRELDRLDRERDRALLVGVGVAQLYEAALTVMMRLVFLFSAEERELLPLGDELYDQRYAVSPLRERLRESADQHGEEALARRADVWCRLLATFRGVYGGIEHEAVRLPAYGGKLFDPDRFPFLEGRAPGTSWRDTAADPLPVNNRIVLHLLEALRIPRIKVPGGAPESRRLSFRALDIEHLEHVYEGLLDHTATRANTTMLGLLGARNHEPQVALDELEAERAKGEKAFLDFLKEQTGRSVATLRKALDTDDASPALPKATDAQRLLVACDNDRALFERVLPFSRLIRPDMMNYPVVIKEGGVYVTAGSRRRTTGTHYTPRSLTAEIVRHTLEPLVYEGVAEGWPREEWRLRPAAELLELKICDVACGSGAFLVQVCRYLAERLVEAWDEAETRNRGTVCGAPGGTASRAEAGERLLPREPEERLAIARRVVADRCLYGVDRNSMAVEMAKLSLWLITLQKNRPFTFLDHAIRWGDSLLGATNFRQLEAFQLDPSEAAAHDDALEEIEEQPESPARLMTDAVTERNKVDLAGDERIADLRVHVARLLADRRPFHWVLEFPEIFAGGVDASTREPRLRGFDAVVGNPPFIGGKKITGALGTDYRDYLVEHLAGGRRGNADLVAYFFLRVKALLRAGGYCGLVATNTVAQGDTRAVGLDQLTRQGGTIYRAVPSRPWSGTASLEVAHVWLRNAAEWTGRFVLDGEEVGGITPSLSAASAASGNPFRLMTNAEKSFIGSFILGMGFVLKPDEAAALIASDASNKDVVFPYLNGEDLNTRPDQSPSRWVINFGEMPLSRETAPPGHAAGAVVAADYPACLRIVEKTVKPQRAAGTKFARREWWIYQATRSNLYRAISRLDRCLVTSRVSAHHFFSFTPRGQVLSDRLVVVALDGYADFAVLSSMIHDLWAHRPGTTTHETRNTYFPEAAFETFPFPRGRDSLERTGAQYHRHRQAIMRSRREGLTKIYNRFHDAKETSADIRRLRELHVEMDNSVVAAYGWSELDLAHGFRQTKQGTRFTVSAAARREVLDRLLQLNHERYAEEAAAGLHDKGAKKKITAARPAKAEAKAPTKRRPGSLRR